MWKQTRRRESTIESINPILYASTCSECQVEFLKKKQKCNIQEKGTNIKREKKVKQRIEKIAKNTHKVSYNHWALCFKVFGFIFSKIQWKHKNVPWNTPSLLCFLFSETSIEPFANFVLKKLLLGNCFYNFYNTQSFEIPNFVVENRKGTQPIYFPIYLYF